MVRRATDGTLGLLTYMGFAMVRMASFGTQGYLLHAGSCKVY